MAVLIATRKRYSLKNFFRMLLVVAPLTFRMAISFLRCSQVKVTREKTPNIEIIMQTAEVK